MNTEFVETTIQSLTASDTHGVLSITDVGDSIKIEFDQGRVAEVDDLIALPEGARLGLSDPKLESSIRDLVVDFNVEEFDRSNQIKTVGGVLISDEVFILPDIDILNSSDDFSNFLHQYKKDLDSPLSIPSEGVAAETYEGDSSDRTDLLVLANSEALIEAVELRYLVSLARRSLSRYESIQTSNRRAVSAISYVAAEFLRRSIASTTDPKSVERVVVDVCNELGIDRQSVDQELERQNRQTDTNAWEFFADLWDGIDAVDISPTSAEPSTSDSDESNEPLPDQLQRLEKDVEEIRALSTERLQELEEQVEEVDELSSKEIERLENDIASLGEEVEEDIQDLESFTDELRSSSRDRDQELETRLEELRQRIQEIETIDHTTTDHRRIASPEDALDDHLGRPWSPPEALDASRPLTKDDTNLHFPDSLPGTEDLFERIHAALVGGKHLILTGPPGSGKTTLAREICERYAPDHELTTATSDWRTFDTVGGYRQRDDGTLEFSPGVFLRRWSDPDPDPTGGEPDEEEDSEDPTPAGRNEWLVVDELNRADADQAFGSLFTILTEETVTLSFDTPGGDPVTVVGDPDDYDGLYVEHDGDEVPEARRSHYFVPQSWRLVATANSADKATLYRLSYAFMRRFEFVHIPAPGLATLTDDTGDPRPSVVEPYLDCWVEDWRIDFEEVAEEVMGQTRALSDIQGIDTSMDDLDDIDFSGLDGIDDVDTSGFYEIGGDVEVTVVAEHLRTVLAEHLAQIWKASSTESRAVGPGIISDLAEHALVRLSRTGQLTYDQAVAGTLLPQFENRREELGGFVEELAGLPGFEGIDDTNPDAATAVLAADYLDVDVTPDAGGSDS